MVKKGNNIFAHQAAAQQQQQPGGQTNNTLTNVTFDSHGNVIQRPLPGQMASQPGQPQQPKQQAAGIMHIGQQQPGGLSGQMPGQHNQVHQQNPFALQSSFNQQNTTNNATTGGKGGAIRQPRSASPIETHDVLRAVATINVSALAEVNRKQDMMLAQIPGGLLNPYAPQRQPRRRKRQTPQQMVQTIPDDIMDLTGEIDGDGCPILIDRAPPVKLTDTSSNVAILPISSQRDSSIPPPAKPEEAANQVVQPLEIRSSSDGGIEVVKELKPDINVDDLPPGLRQPLQNIIQAGGLIPKKEEGGNLVKQQCPQQPESNESEEQSVDSNEKELGLQGYNQGLNCVSKVKRLEAEKKSMMAPQNQTVLATTGFSLANQFREGDRSRLIQKSLGDTSSRLLYNRFCVRTVVSRKKPKSHRDLNYDNGADQREHANNLRSEMLQKRRHGTTGGKGIFKMPGQVKPVYGLNTQSYKRAAKAPIVREEDGMNDDDLDDISEQEDLRDTTTKVKVILEDEEDEEEEEEEEKMADDLDETYLEDKQPRELRRRDQKARDRSEERKLRSTRLQPHSPYVEDIQLEAEETKIEQQIARAERQEKAEKRREKPFVWSDLRQYFKRITDKDMDFFLKKEDYLCGQFLINKKTGESMIEPVEFWLQEFKNRYKVQRNEITSDIRAIEEHSVTPVHHNLLLQPNCGEGQEPSDYSYLLKFVEQERDSSGKAVDQIMIESTKGSPNERGSNEAVDLSKTTTTATAGCNQAAESVAAADQDPEKATPQSESIDDVILRLESQLAEQQKELSEKFQKVKRSRRHNTPPQSQEKDGGGDLTCKDVPSLELEDVFLVGQRDREAFLEPYNRSVARAQQLFAEHGLPYTELNFELLTMIILVQDEVEPRHKNHLEQVLRRRIQDYLDEIDVFESKMESRLGRQEFFLLFGVEKRTLQDFAHFKQKKVANPFQCLQASHNISAESDEQSFYLMNDIQKRSSQRVAALWIYESLIRTYKSSFCQKVPERPKDVYLKELDEWVDLGISVEDCVIHDSEIGCSICFTSAAPNFNPVMYCKGCGSGVHARCHGDEFIDEIDQEWTCHFCEKKSPLIKLEQELKKEQDEMDAKSNSRATTAIKVTKKERKQKIEELQQRIAKKEKYFNKRAKCHLCQKSEGFMRYQESPGDSDFKIWYHPFCVFTNASYCWKKLPLMQEVVQIDPYKDPMKMKEQCTICEQYERKNRQTMVTCHDCKLKTEVKKFHPMCAWLNAQEFKIEVNPNYDKDEKSFENYGESFEMFFYQAAFKTQITIKCEKCVAPDLGIKTLRERKFMQFQINQQSQMDYECPWKIVEEEGQDVPVDLNEQNRQVLDHQHDDESDQAAVVVNNAASQVACVTAFSDRIAFD